MERELLKKEWEEKKMEDMEVPKSS